MTRIRYIKGKVISWDSLLEFLDTLQPWQTMMTECAERVEKPDANFRRIAAAAVGTCPTSHQFPDNLLDVLKMIARKRPKAFRWHTQIGPARWKETNTYTGALTGWLSDLTPADAARTFLVDESTVERMYGYLGAGHSMLKTAMAKRFLYRLVHDLVTTTNLAIVGDVKRVPKRQIRYQDFSRTWRFNGIRCERLDPTDKVIRDLDDDISQAGPAGESFLYYLRLGSGPICHHSILQYEEIAIYRIGTEWTDPEGHPSDSTGNGTFNRLQADYVESVARWYDGRSAPAQSESRRIHEQVCKVLGKPDERKRTLVDCFRFRSKPAGDLQEATFHWFKVNGCTPLQPLEG